MTAPYRVARLAQEDLDEIWDYVAQQNHAAANRLIDTLQARFALLASHPAIGQSRDDLQSGLRCFTIGSYVIYYHVENEIVTIVRVLHGARDESAFH